MDTQYDISHHRHSALQAKHHQIATETTQSILASYAEVILPLPIQGVFTYSIPESMREEVVVGGRVIVPFGKRKFYTGIVSALTPVCQTPFTVKEITHSLGHRPVVRHPQLKFWEWMAEYYLCNLGDVYKAAVPSGMKIESETMFEPNPDFDTADPTLTEREKMILTLLTTKGKLSAADIEKETGFKSVPALMQKMFAKGAAIVSESMVSRFRARKENCVRIAFGRDDAEALQRAFDAVARAPKQQTALMTLLQLSRFTLKSQPLATVTVNALIDRSRQTSATIRQLIDKGIVERYTIEVSRFAADVQPDGVLPSLSDAQTEALEGIHTAFRDHAVTLLHGVASSGKTEVYMHLIEHVLSQGRQVLLLVPEIALTTQLTTRLHKVFGSRMVVYHSRFTDNERVELWHKILQSNGPLLVVGTRAAVFLPLGKLGLVVVDEEHDPSYKQYDPAPRYNGRDAAIMLAHMHGAKTLLGSATPAIETYYKATTGKYGLVSLTERYRGDALPAIEIVDMAKEKQKKAVNGSFAAVTVSAVREAAATGHQAIIFHSKRGFAPMARCTKCQYIPKCQCCDVSLTYHKHANLLVCHYCGSTYAMPVTCPNCSEPSIEVVGYGTERIEDEVETLFPEYRTLRMDLDTTRNKNSHAELIAKFSEHKADILVGTQMVTKGLDFGDVSTAVVVNADSLINYPDFRSAERAYNMLEQVSGRAGRRDTAGRVLIQTRTPDHPVIGYVRRHDYLGFYAAEIEERELFSYPPFTKLINIYLKHKDEATLENLAGVYADRLRQLFGTRVSGPVKPSVGRVQNLYIRRMMLKLELNVSMSKVKQILRDLYADLHSSIPDIRHLILYYDVDPV